MSFWDHVPIVGTIKRAVTNWSGGEISDYVSCKVTIDDCRHLGNLIAEQQCKTCINSLMNSHIQQLPSPPLVKDILEALGAGVAGAVGWKLLGIAGKEVLGKILIGIGIILAVDALVDVALYFYRLFKIKNAASKAKEQFCNCVDG